MTGESLQLCFLLPWWFLGYLLSNCTFTLALAEQQVYEGPQISIDRAPRTVLSIVFLANRLTISIQTPDKAASAWGGPCLHRALASQEVLLFQPPPATVKLAFALLCFLHLFTPSTETLTLKSWHTLTMKRPIDQIFTRWRRRKKVTHRIL